MVLKRVIRLDSTPLNRAFFTEEGYLIDTPVLTSTGIFEYTNPDGSVRRELRLPEEVFAEDSLDSYMAKPVIITHDAGLVDKNNVSENEIGTILTKGYRDGDNVRAKIVIHDTDSMKESGLKELSLGYNLDLDETPGDWKGMHYDAIQRNIRINHLALVREARAGDKARLNIDSKNGITKGVNIMSYKKAKARRADGLLSEEELAKAIEEYKARHPQPEKADEDPEKPVEGVPVPAKAAENEETVAAIREKQEAKTGEGKEELAEANDTIAHQDEDIQTLLDIIDTLLAERDFKAEKAEDCGDEVVADSEDEPAPEVPVEEEEEASEPEVKEDEDDEEEVLAEDDDDEDDDVIPAENEDDDDDPIPDAEAPVEKPEERLNADSVDAIVRARVKIGIAAEKLHLDGLESMSMKAAKKTIIRAVRPGINLDGKSDAYINAAFDYACEDVKRTTRKDTRYQKKQMFNKDSRNIFAEAKSGSAEDARRKMIERLQSKREKGGKK